MGISRSRQGKPSPESGRACIGNRVNHDDNVGAGRKRETITSLLIPAITPIGGMNLYPHLGITSGHGRGFILACVIHQNDEVDNAGGHDFVIGLPKGASGVVGPA